jgi:peroxiredoxin
MCQPCWDQLKDIEKDIGQFRALGIEEIVSITTDPLDVLEQKVADEALSTPVLSDPDLAVSRSYEANLYGMMGTSRDGHSFIAVGPDGKILWRADYGGAPNFTMYVPVPQLVADMRAGLQGGGN